MANTILEKLQEKYTDFPGMNDARNIAEAVGVINGTGGRGANAIADQIHESIVLPVIPGTGDSKPIVG